MKCDKGSDAWSKFEDFFLTCTAKDKCGFRRRLPIDFFGEDDVFHVNEFRTTLTYTFIETFKKIII